MRAYTRSGLEQGLVKPGRPTDGDAQVLKGTFRIGYRLFLDENPGSLESAPTRIHTFLPEGFTRQMFHQGIRTVSQANEIIHQLDSPEIVAGGDAVQLVKLVHGTDRDGDQDAPAGEQFDFILDIRSVDGHQYQPIDAAAQLLANAQLFDIRFHLRLEDETVETVLHGFAYCSAQDVTRVGIIKLEKRYTCY